MEMSTFGRIKDALLDDLQYDEIKALLHGVPISSLKVADADGLDLIHHAILSNCSDGLRLLLIKNIFLEDELPETCPYLHLAAATGHPTIMNILLQERPKDLQFKYMLKNACKTLRQLLCGPCWRCGSITDSNSLDNKNIPTVDLLENDTPLSALDIAAYKGNIKCVEIMLGSKLLKTSPKFNILECAVEVQSLYAVKLLLKTNKFSTNEVAKAFKKALLWKLSSFVDALLQGSNQDIRDEFIIVLNGMNPYHVMFMYSSAFQIYGGTNRYKGLKDTTEVLVKHNFDLNQSLPHGSYPLYSLLCSLVLECVQYSSILPHHHYQTLKFILKTGVDTKFLEENSSNFSASNVGDILLDIKNSVACGRALYKSATHAVIQEISVNHLVCQEQVQFIQECLELIIEYEVQIETETLFLCISALAFQHSHGDIVDFTGILLLFIKFGANPNYFQLMHQLNSLPNEDIVMKQPVHLPGFYFYELLRISKEDRVNWQRITTNKGVDQILNLLRYMDPKTAEISTHEIEDMFKKEASGDIYEYVAFDSDLDSFFIHAECKLREMNESVEDLSFLCKKVVWSSVQHNHMKLNMLAIPSNLKKSVLNIFS